MRNFLVLMGAVGALVVPVGARASEDTQYWTNVGATIKLGERWRLSQEIIARFSDDRNGLYEIESNTMVGYRLDHGVTLWAGYTHDPQYEAGRFAVMEHRGRQQVTWDNLARIAGGTVSARLRVEERWREHIPGTAWRVRPFVKYVLPISARYNAALVLSHESFIDLNRTNFQRVNGQERMRNLIAINVPVSKTASVELGYLNQHGFRPDGEDSGDHVASIALAANF